MNAEFRRPELEVDRHTGQRFLDALFRHADPGSYLAVRAFSDLSRDEKAYIVEGVKVGAPHAVDRVWALMHEAANHSVALVLCAPVATFLTERGAKTTDLANGVALSVECDSRPAEARATLSALLGPPTLVVASGGMWVNPDTGVSEARLHLHWRLATPTRTQGEHKLLREARMLATRLVGADATGISVVHPFRWPGSWHRKNTPRLCTIIESNDTELDLQEALAILRKAAPAERERPEGERKRSDRSDRDDPFCKDEARFKADLMDVVAALTVIPNPDLPWDEWNRIGMATWLASSGQAFAAFDAWSRQSSKYVSGETADRWKHYSTSPPDSIGAGTLFFLAAEAMPGWKPSKAQSSQSSREESNGDGNAGAGDREPPPGIDDAGAATSRLRRVIRIAAGELPRMADEAELALKEAGLPVFVRAGTLVRPVTEQLPAAHGTTTVAKLRELCPDALADWLSSAALFERFDGRSKKVVPADPPAQVASLLLVREGSWSFPRVSGVITTPTLRPDGSVLASPGYDAATRLYLAPDDTLRLPPLSERTTRAEAEDALELLRDLLSAFPFAAEVDRAVALSGLITAVVRGALPVAPMHVVRAHTPGTGKSLLVDVASTIATGRPCPVIAAGKTAEETEKRLGALLRDGVPIVSIDNVVGELGGDMLCQMTERPLVRIRILGRSEAPEFECKATIFATGNNLTLLGDMTRRAVLCSLDAGVERPELRRFGFDPIARVLADRGAYVAAALTIARAYRDAGSPEVCSPIGSYGAWSHMVRSPLIWLGEADPVMSMETAREEDPDLMSIRELFGHWQERLQLNEGYTSNGIIQVACEKSIGGTEFRYPEFRDVLLRVAGDGGAVSSRRLGRWLTRSSGRIVEGLRLMSRADSSHGNRFILCSGQSAADRAAPPF